MNIDNPKAIEAAKNYHKNGADYQEQFNYLVMHPNQLPQEAESGADPLAWSDPWQARTLADAYKERPPRQYVTGNIFKLPSLNILYAHPGALKSFLLQDLAICVAMGKNWLQPATWLSETEKPQALKTIQSPVIWIDQDNGTDETDDRFKMLAEAHKAPQDIPLKYYSFPAPLFNANDEGLIGGMILRAKEQNAKVIFIDNLIAISGGLDENSSQIAGVMFNLRRVVNETGAAITLIHHPRKGNGQSSGRAGDSLRGHSSIEGNLDLALKLQRDGNIVTVESTKTRGQDVYPFSAYFSVTPDEKEACFFGLPAEDNQSNQAIIREIKAALQGGKVINQTTLVSTVSASLKDVGPKRIRNCIMQESERGKWLVVRKGKNNANLYNLA